MENGINFINLQDALPRKVSNLQTSIKNYISNALHQNQFNITLEMYLVLRCLWEVDGRNQQEIANILYRDKASLTNLIDNLEKRNLVSSVQNEVDRRSKNIFLTKEGQQMKQKVMPIIQNLLDIIEESTTPEELQLTLRVLDKLYLKIK